MKLDEFVFDDIVVEENCIWSQVCNQCANKLEFENIFEEIPSDQVICGIENCSNIAEFYIELNRHIKDEK